MDLFLLNGPVMQWPIQGWVEVGSNRTVSPLNKGQQFGPLDIERFIQIVMVVLAFINYRGGHGTDYGFSPVVVR